MSSETRQGLRWSLCLARMVARSCFAFWGLGEDGWQAGFQIGGRFSRFLSWDFLLSQRELALHAALSPDDISRELLSSRN